jgi:hypothetical protein
MLQLDDPRPDPHATRASHPQSPPRRRAQVAARCPAMDKVCGRGSSPDIPDVLVAGPT